MSYENAKIVMLPIDSITPHPNNPRKELGDLAELAESIKTKGIMQNLTVVPNKGGDGYTVIIGHRRLSAARLAGLSEVPCAIVEMDEGDQLATMLLENMQRTDLTVYEQAEGFQLLLSNEFSVSDIAEKTGFSESTIRKRVKLLSLDKAKFKASEGRQVNLGDYERLYKIENEDKRNELLDSLGTNNFENEYRKALREQEDQAKVQELYNYLKSLPNVEFVSEAEKESKMYRNSWYTYEKCIYFNFLNKPRLDECQYYRVHMSKISFSIYRKLSAEEKNRRELRTTKDRIRDEFCAEAKEINTRMHDLRENWMLNPPKINEFKRTNILLKEFLRYVIDRTYTRINCLGEDNCKFDDVFNEDGGVKIMLAYLQREMDHSRENGYINCYNVDNPRDIDERLNKEYYLLTRLGYEMSDEEKQLHDGTHEIFTKYKKARENESI